MSNRAKKPRHAARTTRPVGPSGPLPDAVAVIADELMSAKWEDQSRLYPATGEPGLSYFRGDIDEVRWVDCLLYRSEDGDLRGVLNHYPIDFPPFEKAGNVTAWVDPDWYRNGIGTALFAEADRRWRINWNQQLYTPRGLSTVRAYLAARQSS